MRAAWEAWVGEEGTLGMHNCVRQVARRAGFEDPTVGVFVLRSAHALFPEDDEITQSVMYLRHNRSRQCALSVGDPIPSVPLVRYGDASESALSLSDHVAALSPRDAPVVLLAGSVT
jgi:hypothetical protein